MASFAQEFGLTSFFKYNFVVREDEESQKELLDPEASAYDLFMNPGRASAFKYTFYLEKDPVGSTETLREEDLDEAAGNPIQYQPSPLPPADDDDDDEEDQDEFDFFYPPVKLRNLDSLTTISFSSTIPEQDDIPSMVQSHLEKQRRENATSSNPILFGEKKTTTWEFDHHVDID